MVEKGSAHHRSGRLKRPNSGSRRSGRLKVGRTQRNTYKRTVKVRVINFASGDVSLSRILPKTTSIAYIMDIVSPRCKGILMFGERKLGEFSTLGRVIDDAHLRRGATLKLALLKLPGSNLRRYATFDR